MHGDSGVAPRRFSAGEVFWGVQYHVRLEDFDGTFDGISNADFQFGYHSTTIIEDVDINNWDESSEDLAWGGFHANTTTSGALDFGAFFTLSRSSATTGLARLLWDYTIFAAAEAFDEDDIAGVPAPTGLLLVAVGLVGLGRRQRGRRPMSHGPSRVFPTAS